MFQPETEHAADAADAVAEGFNAGEVIIEHVANSPIDHPLIHLPPIFGIDLSITKHVFMLWVVAGTILLVPVLNPHSFESGTRNTPIDLHNLNRVFPGTKNGSLASRFAYQFVQKI